MGVAVKAGALYDVCNTNHTHKSNYAKRYWYCKKITQDTGSGRNKNYSIDKHNSEEKAGNIGVLFIWDEPRKKTILRSLVVPKKLNDVHIFILFSLLEYIEFYIVVHPDFYSTSNNLHIPVYYNITKMCCYYWIKSNILQLMMN